MLAISRSSLKICFPSFDFAVHRICTAALDPAPRPRETPRLHLHRGALEPR